MTHTYPNEILVASSYLGSDEGGNLVTAEGIEFDPVSYSRMKYGSLLHARNYGVALGNSMLDTSPQIMYGSDPVTALSIYKTVPSAAALVTSAALSTLNFARSGADLDPIAPIHVKMQHVLGTDYSTLDHKGRQKYIKDTGYQLYAHDVAGTNVILIDDIRITGEAEKLGRSLLEGKGHKKLILGYLAIMDPEVAKINAGIEKQINISAVNELDDIVDIIENDGLQVTLRTMKRVMEEPVADKLESFLHEIPENILFDLYSGALSSGREFTTSYASGFDIVRSVATERLSQEPVREGVIA